MGIKEQIVDDMKAAMKAKDSNTLSVLRMMKAKFMEFETAKAGNEIDDDKAISLIQNLIKQRKDSAQTYAENGRQEMANKENAEIDVLAKYLPEAISEDVIQATVTEVIEQTGASSPKDMGKVMGAVMGKLKSSGGVVDGAIVQRLVKEGLSA